MNLRITLHVLTLFLAAGTVLRAQDPVIFLEKEGLRNLVNQTHKSGSGCTVSGTAYDEHGATIPNVDVVVESPRKTLDDTTVMGEFKIESVPEGAFFLSLQSQGFQKKAVRLVCVSGASIKTNFYLSPLGFVIEEPNFEIRFVEGIEVETAISQQRASHRSPLPLPTRPRVRQ